MKVAIVAPPFGDTGGPEIVTQHLTDALIERGIDVTLFAPGDWKTKAKHIPTIEKSIWNLKNVSKLSEQETKDIKIKSQMKVSEYQDEFDIIHLHSQKYADLVGKKLHKPCILTFHNKIKKEELERIKLSGVFTVAQSAMHSGENEVDAIISNGIPVEKIEYSLNPGKYLVAAGRLTEPKGIHVAIEMARLLQKKLLIFGRRGNSPERKKYFQECIEPYLNRDIVFMGQLPLFQVLKHFKEAEALIYPIKPATRLAVCPLIVMESLACGTPIIGTPIEGFKPLSKPSQLGFVSYNKEELLRAARDIDQFDRKQCRKFAEQNFSDKKMADNYIALYEKVLK